MTRSRFINVIIGASLAIMTGAYNLEFAKKEEKKIDVILYIGGHPVKATITETEYNKLFINETYKDYDKQSNQTNNTFHYFDGMGGPLRGSNF